MGKIKYLGFVFIFLLLVLISQLPLQAGSAGRPGIESAKVQPSGGMLFRGGLRLESSRRLREQSDEEYDNFRFFPLNFSYGLVEDFWRFNRLEVGGNIAFAENSSEEEVTDDNGLEGVTFYTKGRWNDYIATALGFKLAGEAEVAPYGSDGTDFFVNFPFRAPAGPGRIIGEVGYTLKDGKRGDTELENYFNYGIGYEFLVNPELTLRTELTGHGNTVKEGAEMLGLLMGLDYKVTETSRLKPAVEFGLEDGSPNYTFAVAYQWEFGDRGPARQPLEEAGDELFGSPVNSREEKERPRIVRKEKESAEDTALNTTGKSRAREKSKQALAAFNAGRLEEATKLFEEALEFSPENVEYLSNLATVHFHRENFQQAKDYYQRAIEIAPEDLPANIGLGVVYFQLGKKQQARKQFERVLEIDPGNRQARQYLDNINRNEN
ncbi:MAG: tetratricopeptide repeat protein [bacterium]